RPTVSLSLHDALPIFHNPDFDTHAATAKKMYGLSGEPTKQQRKFAKIMNFAMLYGAGEDKITSQLISLLSTKEARRSCIELGYQDRKSTRLNSSHVKI